MRERPVNGEIDAYSEEHVVVIVVIVVAVRVEAGVESEADDVARVL